MSIEKLEDRSIEEPVRTVLNETRINCQSRIWETCLKDLGDVAPSIPNCIASTE